MIAEIKLTRRLGAMGAFSAKELVGSAATRLIGNSSGTASALGMKAFSMRIRAKQTCYFASFGGANTPVAAGTEIFWFFAYALPAAARISTGEPPALQISSAS